MDGGCYIPNNPAHYGLSESGTCSTQFWPPDDMGSFSLSPLDLDPLFPFSPSNGYKNDFAMMKDRGSGTGDMADVLLSLKHPIVHPGQMSPSGLACGGNPQCQGTSASLSYTVHPQMLSMSPGGGCSTQYCSGGAMEQNAVFAGLPATGSGQHNVNVFPSMSVNVSMNMTMHGYPTPMNADNIHAQMPYPQADQGLHELVNRPMTRGYPQVQWSSGNANTSPVYCPTQNLLSPQPYNNGASATYSFTADFRPQTMQGGTIPAEAPPANGTGLGGRSGRRHTNPANFSANITASASASACFHSTSNPLKLSPASEEDALQTNLCRICGKTYARPSTLKTHLRTHSGEKPYRCDECNKSFSQAANLTAHVRTHSGEKPFRCPICDRRFSQSSSVTTHIRTHSGERPYRCRLCKKAFSDSSTLTKHLRIHSGEKPYQCKLCMLRFSQSGNLNRHMRVHGGTFAA